MMVRLRLGLFDCPKWRVEAAPLSAYFCRRLASVVEANGLLQDAVTLIDHLVAENNELKANGKRARSRPAKRQPEAGPIDIPDFLGPKMPIAEAPRSRIKRLTEREQELRSYLLEHPQDRIGLEYIVTVGSQSRKNVDLKALATQFAINDIARACPCPTCDQPRGEKAKAFVALIYEMVRTGQPPGEGPLLSTGPLQCTVGGGPRLPLAKLRPGEPAVTCGFGVMEPGTAGWLPPRSVRCRGSNS
jgi:hypothetical protein